MTAALAIIEYVRLGEILAIIQNASPFDVTVIDQDRKQLTKQLEACGLTSTLAAAKPLGELYLKYHPHTRRLDSSSLAQVTSIARAVSETLAHECSGCQLVAIESGAVNQRLREIPTKIELNPTQLHLLNETMTCLEGRAYRAASVMGWNFAYDYIRQWTFDKHLTAFNDALLAGHTNKKTGDPVFSEIVNYEDFFGGSPGERVVLDASYDAKLFGKRIHEELLQCLRRRNDYAHRSFRTPTAEQSNAFVSDLIDVIECPPFA